MHLNISTEVVTVLIRLNIILCRGKKAFYDVAELVTQTPKTMGVKIILCDVAEPVELSIKYSNGGKSAYVI